MAVERTTATQRERVMTDLPQPAGPSQGELVPHEYATELAERLAHLPATISAIGVRDVERAAATARALQEASIRLTTAEDWVPFPLPDGGRIGFLQDRGCSRVRGLWGISFAAPEFEERELPDGNWTVEVRLEAVCAITGETAYEVGFRSTDGFFAKAWTAARKDESHVEQARLRADVRKSAIANARGRCIRTLTGLAGVAEGRLRELGLVLRDGPKFQGGGRGGAGRWASDAQVNLLLRLIRQRGPDLIAGETTTGQLAEWVRGVPPRAPLEGKAASALIDRLQDPAPVRLEELTAVLGPPPWETAGPATGNLAGHAPGAARASDRPPAGAVPSAPRRSPTRGAPAPPADEEPPPLDDQDLFGGRR